MAPDLWLSANENVLSLSGGISKLSKNPNNPKQTTNLIEVYTKALTDVIIIKIVSLNKILIKAAV